MMCWTAPQVLSSVTQQATAVAQGAPSIGPGSEMLRSLVLGGLSGFGSFTDRTRKAQLGTTVKTPSVPTASLGVIVPDSTRQLQ